MTYEKAKAAAIRKAKQNAEPYYVIYIGEDVGGPFAAATDEDLETFYRGTADRNILLCTGDL